MSDLFIALAIAVYNIAALSGALYLVVVITQAENDLHIRRTDRPGLRRARKRAFYGDAAFVLLSVCFQKYWLLNPTIISVALVMTGHIAGAIWILAINHVSLQERQPPQPQSGHREVPAGNYIHARTVLRSMFTSSKNRHPSP